MQNNWKQLIWLKPKREPKSFIHQTFSKDPEPKQNTGFLEEKTTDLGDPLEATFHSIPEGASWTICFHWQGIF